MADATSKQAKSGPEVVDATSSALNANIEVVRVSLRDRSPEKDYRKRSRSRSRTGYSRYPYKSSRRSRSRESRADRDDYYRRSSRRSSRSRDRERDYHDRKYYKDSKEYYGSSSSRHYTRSRSRSRSKSYRYSRSSKYKDDDRYYGSSKRSDRDRDYYSKRSRERDDRDRYSRSEKDYDRERERERDYDRERERERERDYDRGREREREACSKRDHSHPNHKYVKSGSPKHETNTNQPDHNIKSRSPTKEIKTNGVTHNSVKKRSFDRPQESKQAEVEKEESPQEIPSPPTNLLSPWQAQWNKKHKKYSFFNPVTRRSSWTLPKPSIVDDIMNLTSSDESEDEATNNVSKLSSTSDNSNHPLLRSPIKAASNMANKLKQQRQLSNPSSTVDDNTSVSSSDVSLAAKKDKKDALTVDHNGNNLPLGWVEKFSKRKNQYYYFHETEGRSSAIWEKEWKKLKME